MATPPSSPSPTKSPAPDSAAAANTAAAAASPLARPPPTAWSHQETVYLIQIYQDKWYAHKRAALKAPQWEEIATAVAARFGGTGKLPPKTPTQCRHKMEKLRKRFRAERQRGGGGPTGWPFYDLMDRLERGPKAPARPSSQLTHRAKSQNFHSNSHGFRGHHNEYDEDEEEEEDDYGRYDDNNNDDEEDGNYGRSQSINYILRRPTVVNRFPSDQSFSSSSVPGFMPRHLAPVPKKMREDVEEQGEQKEAQAEKERMRRVAVAEMAGEIRAFAETYVGMENAKMEMIRDAERSRLEMESKRMEMILDSQRKIVEAIAKALDRPQKGAAKIDQES
ncbi:trihelix transcription factor ASIL1 [Punica granatum]|uniref:Trihelix transcription factor ASIL1 n=1 Tax=Punica granatum TaxID=22663 RepID=A0A6P8BV51_PUNGR|nr:trihelix transcription factor ASIL1 [Punica granatum]